MSDLHPLPLVGHDMPVTPEVRGRVWRAGQSWYWGYANQDTFFVTAHGPFGSWREAYDSAHRMVSLL